MNPINTLGWQGVLFSDSLNRFELLKLRAQFRCAPIKVTVRRNHGVEQMISALPPFLAFVGTQAQCAVGDYDDSLSFPHQLADVELVWLDFDRYAHLPTDELTEWLIDRLNALRAQSGAAIVVANASRGTVHEKAVNSALEDWVAKTPRTATLDLATISQRLGPLAFDERRSRVTGTRLSDATCLEAAREFGFRLAPRLLLGRPLKAIAVDLDNTIYGGVLGEDGVHGVQLTSGHRALQELLVELHNSGLFIVIVSKNEISDVNALFASRDDFPLKNEHVSDWQVSWMGKASGVAAAAVKLRIAPDTFLLVDDNLGELTEVANELPGVRLVYAGESPEHTHSTLQRYPGLSPDTTGDADVKRIADLRANEDRDALAAASTSPEDYLRSLGVEMELRMNPSSERRRLAEMSNKTNQFNLALARFDEIAVDFYLSSPDKLVVMISIKDRLAEFWIGGRGVRAARRKYAGR